MEKLGTYNKFMPTLKWLLTIILFSVNSSVYAIDDASADNTIAAQRTACAANTAMEWSAKSNRCVAKQTALDNRNAIKNCDAITDLASKQKCHMTLAEQNSGLSSDTSTLNQGKTTNSMVMNGIATAYAAVSILSNWGKSGEYSNCTSKKILGVTSVAGLASDVYLKMKAKKKVKELEGKYQLDLKSSSQESQVKALEYLKEEQQTVVSIASMEKKRNLALMIGYGVAAGWAVYELTPYGQNPDCVKKAEDPKDTKAADTAKAETPKAESGEIVTTARADGPPVSAPGGK